MTTRFVVEFGKDTPPPSEDGRLDAPAFHRNSAPIRALITRVLGGRSGDALELGSGTGQHIHSLAEALPRLTWWPTDPHPAHRRSIEAWRRSSGLGNIMPPVDLDAAQAEWPLGQPGYPPGRGLAGMVCINVLHIAPWAVAEGLLAAAARHLAPDGCLILYGPYSVGGTHTAPSNATFDAELRAQNPAWGVRDTDAIARLAVANGLKVTETVPMPANNLTLVLMRDRSA